MFTRITSLVVALIFLFVGTACPAATEDPDEVEPVEEPEVVEEEVTAEDEMELTRIQTEIHAERAGMLEFYEQLDGAYQMLEQADQIDPELAELLPEMRQMYTDLQEQHEMMEQDQIEVIGQRTSPDEAIIYVRDEYGEQRMEHDQMMMPERTEVEQWRERHTEIVDTHEEMADLNSDVDRDDMARHHEMLAERHNNMEDLHDELLNLLDDVGISLAR